MHTRSVLIGAAAGTALMYLLDPTGGRRRRALVRDKVARATRRTRHGVNVTAHDMFNRARGVAAAARGRWWDQFTTDSILVDRVKSKLGRVCSHHAIEVDALDGIVTLRGPVLAADVKRVLSGVAAVRGVHGINNQLEGYESAVGMPSLQGHGHVAFRARDFRQRRWWPATRAMVTAGVIATGALMAMKRRGSRTWEHQYEAM
jgi:hypothetical protein